MWEDISIHQTIIARAQQSVDRLRRGASQVSSARELDADARWFWGALAQHQIGEAFLRVAAAIQSGKGHAFRNREPLLRITRQYFH